MSTVKGKRSPQPCETTVAGACVGFVGSGRLKTIADLAATKAASSGQLADPEGKKLENKPMRSPSDGSTTEPQSSEEEKLPEGEGTENKPKKHRKRKKQKKGGKSSSSAGLSPEEGGAGSAVKRPKCDEGDKPAVLTPGQAIPSPTSPPGVICKERPSKVQNPSLTFARCASSFEEIGITRCIEATRVPASDERLSGGLHRCGTVHVLCSYEENGEAFEDDRIALAVFLVAKTATGDRLCVALIRTPHTIGSLSENPESFTLDEECTAIVKTVSEPDKEPCHRAWTMMVVDAGNGSLEIRGVLFSEATITLAGFCCTKAYVAEAACRAARVSGRQISMGKWMRPVDCGCTAPANFGKQETRAAAEILSASGGNALYVLAPGKPEGKIVVRGAPPKNFLSLFKVGAILEKAATPPDEGHLVELANVPGIEGGHKHEIVVIFRRAGTYDSGLFNGKVPGQPAWIVAFALHRLQETEDGLERTEEAFELLPTPVCAGTEFVDHKQYCPMTTVGHATTEVKKHQNPALCKNVIRTEKTTACSRKCFRILLEVVASLTAAKVGELRQDQSAREEWVTSALKLMRRLGLEPELRDDADVPAGDGPTLTQLFRAHYHTLAGGTAGEKDVATLLARLPLNITLGPPSAGFKPVADDDDDDDESPDSDEPRRARVCGSLMCGNAVYGNSGANGGCSPGPIYLQRSGVPQPDGTESKPSVECYACVVRRMKRVDPGRFLPDGDIFSHEGNLGATPGLEQIGGHTGVGCMCGRAAA